MTPTRSLACAIYTRKSTGEGLDQSFNSLDAQREACEAYVRSQAHEGWHCLPDHYDDGGFSGGSMDRPALQRLMDDITRGRIDVVVVYKVDRLTRSLADFAKLVALFDARGVSFVSVTQSFNTTSSMGRLTLNVLLSFAQFEREVTAERIRDKIAASKAKGLRVGGPVPLGYGVEYKRLVPHPVEAGQVRLIFERYRALGCLTGLTAELAARGIHTKVRHLKDGTTRGGIPFTKGPLAYLLRNRVHVGDVVHKGTAYRGHHPPIVDRDLFEAVRARLSANAVSRSGPVAGVRCPPHRPPVRRPRQPDDADPNVSFSGASFVVFGKTDGTAVELSDVETGIGGFVLNGVSAVDRSGISVSGAGDVDGDSFDDLIVGAFGDDPNSSSSGASFVVFGGTSPGRRRRSGPSGTIHSPERPTPTSCSGGPATTASSATAATTARTAAKAPMS